MSKNNPWKTGTKYIILFVVIFSILTGVVLFIPDFLKSIFEWI